MGEEAEFSREGRQCTVQVWRHESEREKKRKWPRPESQPTVHIWKVSASTIEQKRGLERCIVGSSSWAPSLPACLVPGQALPRKSVGRLENCKGSQGATARDFQAIVYLMAEWVASPFWKGNSSCYTSLTATYAWEPGSGSAQVCAFGVRNKMELPHGTYIRMEENQTNQTKVYACSLENLRMQNWRRWPLSSSQ